MSDIDVEEELRELEDELVSAAVRREALQAVDPDEELVYGDEPLARAREIADSRVEEAYQVLRDFEENQRVGRNYGVEGDPRLIALLREEEELEAATLAAHEEPQRVTWPWTGRNQ